MNPRLAILCPGQGGQHPAMFDLLRTDARAAGFIERCRLDELLGAPLQQVLSDPQALFANAHAQPLVVAAQLAAWHAIADQLRDTVGAPAVVVGYSVGELSAAAVSGVFAPHAVVPLAARRAALMDAAVQQPQGLMAVSGLDLQLVTRCLRRHGAYVAIINGEDAVIAGGLHPSLSAAAAELVGQGARCSGLPVSVASHTPLLRTAQAPFAALLAGLATAPSETTLLAGVSGQAVSDAGDVAGLLARQLVEPIQWVSCMDACVERGIMVALELGPGAALSHMLRARHPTIACRSLSDFRTLGGALAWLQRQVD